MKYRSLQARSEWLYSSSTVSCWIHFSIYGGWWATHGRSWNKFRM